MRIIHGSCTRRPTERGVSAQKGSGGGGGRSTLEYDGETDQVALLTWVLALRDWTA